MGHCHVLLDKEASKMCTMIVPWSKCKCLRLPQGLANAPDIFQEEMNNLFHELEFVCCHMDDLLVTNKGNCRDHLRKLEQVFSKLRHAGLQVNPTKSFWAKPECEHLSYTMSKKGIEPQSKKAKAILEIKPPKDLK